MQNQVFLCVRTARQRALIETSGARASKPANIQSSAIWPGIRSGRTLLRSWIHRRGNWPCRMEYARAGHCGRSGPARRAGGRRVPRGCFFLPWKKSHPIILYYPQNVQSFNESPTSCGRSQVHPVGQDAADGTPDFTRTGPFALCRTWWACDRSSWLPPPRAAPGLPPSVKALIICAACNSGSAQYHTTLISQLALWNSLRPPAVAAGAAPSGDSRSPSCQPAVAAATAVGS